MFPFRHRYFFDEDIMISTLTLLHSSRPLLLLALLCLVASAGVASAQQTGEWIVIDGKHEGRFSTMPTRVAAAGRGHYIVLTREDASIGPYTLRRTTDGGVTWQIIRADSGQTW